MFHSNTYSDFALMCSISAKEFHLAKVRFYHMRLALATGSAGTSALPVKSMLKSKILFESRVEGWSYRGHFSALS